VLFGKNLLRKGLPKRAFRQKTKKLPSFKAFDGLVAIGVAEKSHWVNSFNVEAQFNNFHSLSFGIWPQIAQFSRKTKSI